MWSLFLPRVGSFVLRLLRVMEPHQNRDGVEERVLIPPPPPFFRLQSRRTKPSTSFDPIRVHQMKRKPDENLPA